MKLDDLLTELEAAGIKNDSEISDRSQKKLNITRDTGELLRNRQWYLKIWK